jgi:hypothetical protein
MFSEENPSGYRQSNERAFPPPAPSGEKRWAGYAFPAALFFGLLSIAVVFAYRHSIERDRAACLELMASARSSFGAQAAEVISLYLNDSLKPEWEQSVIQIEDVYNLTFKNCRKMFGG